jgi:hypothetical protein
MEPKAVLFRLREKDTGNGVSRKTLKALATALGVSETDAIHRALADSARAHLPQYAPDDGPLSGAQQAAIGVAVKKAHGRARVVESLFGDEPAGGSRGGHKKIRAAAGSR